MNFLNCRNSWLVVGVMAFLPTMAQGQTRLGSVTMKASVSEIVAISLGPTLPPHHLRIDTQADRGTLTLALSGSGTDVIEARVPILIRSNTPFNISALVRSQTSTLVNFSVLEARPIGRFVAADAIANLNVAPERDGRATNGKVQTTAPDLLPLNLSAPSSILSGPRVSLAGTLDSADNALEVIIIIGVKPDAGATMWQLNLSLSGSASVRL